MRAVQRVHVHVVRQAVHVCFTDNDTSLRFWTSRNDMSGASRRLLLLQ